MQKYINDSYRTQSEMQVEVVKKFTNDLLQGYFNCGLPQIVADCVVCFALACLEIVMNMNIYVCADAQPYATLPNNKRRVVRCRCGN